MAGTKIVMSMKESLAMCAILQERYTLSGLTDQEFADSVNATPEERKLFRSPVTRSNVSAAREATDTPANHVRAYASRTQGEDCVLIGSRLALLEDRVNKLAAFLRNNTTFKE